jgi:hypothetical protein
MGQIHHKPSDGFRPATELDPMHPPEAELVMAWDGMEVEEEFQRRGLGAFAAAAVEARLEGADLFALTDEQMLALGLPPEELASFRWLRARTLRCAAAEEASEYVLALHAAPAPPPPSSHPASSACFSPLPPATRVSPLPVRAQYVRHAERKQGHLGARSGHGRRRGDL